ncbi:uroporphyrinogen-III synthase [Bradyrhizobium sp. 4]|uniref:uroporphyrinogen-III synthase n=1 Tax=unclassified Bradyrhizobium TaxID=2631580 RepID=UPI001FF86C7B|nr:MULTISPECIES: uroporphyrinogen-III synthase [unclassified Bradyrhizobium]MCK1403193.1 uroporphyrinogen-III synthase [Bradyrhizobium sp. 39]MCK1748789.1 uroporphyrinogen-III synthase [Bradyrhizobium sp. 135]UPJ33231.1 uroporphyrinogen-III synthase [Bradyrhizobium sp. 4]
MADRLNGTRILILETREEAQFSKLLTEQGAEVVQCPMFTIQDAPDPAPVEAWIRRTIDKPFDDLVLMTGEGLRRIMKLAIARGLDQALVAALARSRKFTRGPKPGKALREIGLEAQQTTEKPTTDGVIEMLGNLDLKGHRLGLQLYPDKDHNALTDALAAQGAEVDAVLPYAYDSKAADANIVAAIDEMAAGRIDSIALTNLGQVRRLIEAAKAHGSEAKLRAGLERTLIASVGPAVSGELAAHGLRTDVSPADEAYFMRPLISAMATALLERKSRTAAS